MKKSAYSIQALIDLRSQLLSKAKITRDYSNQSFQQYQFHNLEHSDLDLIESLIFIWKQNNIVTTIFDQLVKNLSNYSTSLITYGPQISTLTQQNSLFTVSHQHYASQSILLALYLAKTKSIKVHLVIHNQSLSNGGHMLAAQSEVDKVTFVRGSLQKEGIILHNITEWNSEGLQFENKDCIIMDFFGLNPTQYSPFLIKNYLNIRKFSKVYIYHSHLQDQEIQAFISQLPQTKDNSYFFPLQIWPQHPLETISQKNQKQLLNQLVNFLKEDSNHPQKQDIIIFYPIQVHFKRFTSRLQEQFAKVFLKDQVTLITKAHESQAKGKNNIFIAEGTKQLQDWNYDYSRVLYVIDYSRQTKFRFNYTYGSYVKSTNNCSDIEKARRRAFVGVSRIGRYASLNISSIPNQHYANEAKELSTYLLKMIDYKISQYIDFTNSRIKSCLKMMEQLGIIESSENKLKIIDKRVIQSAKEGISPIQAKIVYRLLDECQFQKQQKLRLANLLLMGLITMHCEGNLRQSKQQLEAAAHIKPNGIWRKSGYLESCLQILTKCELIQTRKSRQNSKSQSFRRKTSKFNEYEYDVYGSLFEILQPKKKQFVQMQIPDLVKEYTVNEDLLHIIRDEVDNMRSVFQIQQTPIIIENQDIDKLQSFILRLNNRAVTVYSGSRKRGYILSDQSNVFSHKASLISQLNQRPQILLILRLAETQQIFQILMCNSLTSEIYLQALGKLPGKRVDSITEMQVQFHGVSSSTFEQLWRNNGMEIVKFQKQNDCFVEANQEISLILIHCGKEQADKIKSQFESILNKIRQKLSVSSKVIHYLGNTNIVLGTGGAVKQIVKSDYISKCLLGNLHLQVTKEDLEELFQQFFTLKNIVVNEPEQGKFYKSAIIQFNSQRDYYKFYEFFHQCQFYERLMDVKPLKIENANKAIAAKQYIQFKWYVWRSHNKALVKFNTAEAALKAVQGFKVNPLLDGVKVIITLTENSLLIEQLKGTTDQLFIQQALKAYGKIDDVQILKTPLKEIIGEDVFLQNLVKATLNNANFKVDPIEKKKNGLRVCRVHMQNVADLNKVANQLNHSTGKLGEGRLYAQTWFQIPVLVPYGSMSIYQQILRQTLQQHKMLNLQTHIEDNDHHNKVYIVLKSSLKDALDLFNIKFTAALQGYNVDLTSYQRSIILTDIGMANILDLQEKYHCRLIVDLKNQTLNVLIGHKYLKHFKEEIKTRVLDHFFYRVSLNSKAFKYFKTNPAKLEEIKTAHALELVQTQIDSRALLLEGSAINVQKAFNYLMHFIESLTVPQEQMVNADVCGICCQEPHRPYRLQSCSHKFCRDCLIQSINMALGDASMFPLKCPHCASDIVIDDLQSILQPTQWVKTQTMATNQYVAKHSDKMTFCYTAGCKQVNLLKSDHIECDVCLAVNCIECKLRYHPGLTCDQAKQGGDQLFKKFMKDNGIRQCPNKNCQIPVERIDGCYRVTCSRCQKSMCFKCQPDKMIAYDDYNLCYAHLNEVHGGYW